MIQISKKELENLQDAKMKLRALEAGGVDNWEGYDISLESYNEAKANREVVHRTFEYLCEILSSGIHEPSEHGAGFAFTDDVMERAEDIILKLVEEKS